MTAEELTEFAASVAGVTAKTWGGAAGAAAADLSGLWAAGTAQGWFGLGQDDALGAVLTALRELGRVACPLPLMDAFVAVRLLGADEKTAAQIASGELRVLVVPDEGTGVTRYLDGGAAATHVLTLPAAGGTASLRPVTGRRVLPGLAVPPWTTADLGPAEAQRPLSAAEAADALVLLRLGLAVRALAAAERSHEMAVEHAKNRRQLELRDFLAATPSDPAALVPAMASRGWFGFGWPAAHSGRDASLAEQVVLYEECMYARAPVTIQLASVMLLGNSILRHGTAAQRQAFLPLIRDGKLHFCLGYSEPEAGSDLASLRTGAERDDTAGQGGGWVINGQKFWTTGGHLASHVWLATRTDPEATPPHAGITVFLVPMDTPGITVQQHTALSGEVSCTVFYDDVRVPDTARVGEVNGGWKVITDALAGERVVMGGIAASLLRQLDDLLAVVRADPDAWLGPRGSAARARLGELAVTLQANRALVAAAIGATASGGGARLETPMAGVLGGELAEEFGEAMLDILGPVAALSGADAPGGGAFEYGLRLSIMYVVGGGTNDIQRGLIARGLGLPR